MLHGKSAKILSRTGETWKLSFSHGQVQTLHVTMANPSKDTTVEKKAKMSKESLTNKM